MVIDADAELLARLRAGDEAAFMELVDRYGPVMLRIARAHTPSRAVAEEVVQEAWLGVVTGLERFEGRSSLKTWLLRIVANRARTRGERERRTVPLSSFARVGVNALCSYAARTSRSRSSSSVWNASMVSTACA